MKGMMQRFSFKPRDLKVLQEGEDTCAKARVMGFSALMFAISAGIFSVYSDVYYRSQQLQ